VRRFPIALKKPCAGKNKNQQIVGIWAAASLPLPNLSKFSIFSKIVSLDEIFVLWKKIY
jgi:hypothetical protein